MLCVCTLPPLHPPLPQLPKRSRAKPHPVWAFQMTPLPRHLPSSALASASVLQPLPGRDMQQQHRDGYGTDRAQGQTSGRTQGQGWGNQRWPEQEPRSLERNPVREGVKTGPLGQEDQNCQVHYPGLPRRWVGPWSPGGGLMGGVGDSECRHCFQEIWL